MAPLDFLQQPPEPVPAPPARRDDGPATAAHVRTLDWSRTPLGPAERWPRSLGTLADMLLAPENAAKFTPPGGRVSVRTRHDEAAGLVVVEVADTGKGIPAGALPRAFDACEQGADEATRRCGGMGLGLAIAKAVVDLRGGTVRPDSAGEGKGATFTATLPVHQGAPPPAAAAAPQGDREPAGGRPVRLLLVEDHADTAKILARLLRRDGIDVRCARGVAEALDIATAEPFDVVVSDLSLPDGSGYDLMRRLRRHRPLVGIAMSGYGREDDIRQSREAGFVEHLVKPVSLEQLRDAIGRVTRTS